jgi:hypothetical protein
MERQSKVWFNVLNKVSTPFIDRVSEQMTLRFRKNTYPSRRIDSDR